MLIQHQSDRFSSLSASLLKNCEYLLLLLLPLLRVITVHMKIKCQHTYLSIMEKFNVTMWIWKREKNQRIRDKWDRCEIAWAILLHVHTHSINDWCDCVYYIAWVSHLYYVLFRTCIASWKNSIEEKRN